MNVYFFDFGFEAGHVEVLHRDLPDQTIGAGTELDDLAVLLPLRRVLADREMKETDVSNLEIGFRLSPLSIFEEVWKYG